MKKIKVLVVDDSSLFRRFIIDGLSKVNFLEVVGYAVDPIDAKSKIELLKPDVISCDIEMPKMDGLTFIKTLMAKNPMRVVVVSSLNVSVFDVMSAGAIDFVKKPVGNDADLQEQFLKELTEKIFIASQARLQAVHRFTPPPTPAQVPGRAPQKQGVQQGAHSAQNAQRPQNTQNKANHAVNPIMGINASLPKFGPNTDSTVIALGASTGGTEALIEVVKNLPPNTPGIVIVQHMPPGFTKMYADRLNRICRMNAKEAENGDVIRRGLILIAPGDLQMSVVKNMGQFNVRCVPGEKVTGHRPSVDVLFSSVAKVACPNAIGAILTGMGGDGAKGLLEMKQSGAYTIGQDEESCVVYGMPMVAYNMGAVQVQAPLGKIPELIVSHLLKK